VTGLAASTSQGRRAPTHLHYVEIFVVEASPARHQFHRATGTVTFALHCWQPLIRVRLDEHHELGALGEELPREKEDQVSSAANAAWPNDSNVCCCGVLPSERCSHDTFRSAMMPFDKTFCVVKVPYFHRRLAAHDH